MNSLKASLKKIPRFAWWVTGLLTMYAALGFLFVPWLAERQLKSILDERLQLTADVESIHFNPFSMVAQIDSLSIVNDDGSPLLDLRTLYANFQPTRLVLLRLQFRDLAITDLDLNIERDAGGLDTFTRLAQHWSDTAAPVDSASDETDDGAEENGLVPMVVESVSLSNLSFHVLDEVPTTPFETSLRLANVEVGNLSTLPDNTGSKRIVLEFEDQAVLSIDGELSLNPVELRGSLSLENFALSTVSRYLQDTLPLSIDSGRLAFSVAYDAGLFEDGPAANLSQIRLAISDLAAVQDGMEQPFLNAALLQADNGTLSYPENQLAFESLQLDRLEIAATREAGEQINLQQLAAGFMESGTADPAPEADQDSSAQVGSPWEISLQRLALTDNRITFSDRDLEMPADVAVDLNIELTGLNNQPGSSFPLNVNLALDSGGELQVDGTLSVLPDPVVVAGVTLDALDLTVLQPYINEFAYIDLESGFLELQSDLVSNPDEPFSYNGDLGLLDISLADRQQGENLLTMNALTVDGIDFSLAENSVDVSEVVFDSLFARVVINEDGTTNIGRTIRPAEPGDTEQVEATSGDTGGDGEFPLAVTVGRIQVVNAASDFTDMNLPVVFDVDIRELEGTVEGFSAPSAQPLEFNLEGNVDEFGLVQLDSAFDPFDLTRQSQVDLRFRNLDMPAMTPYTIKFAGREIASGNMDVSLSYNVEEAQLAANNQVVLRDLQLGERVESPDAMELPLDMATALLKDANGVIDLEVPITGDVNDPEFVLGPAIRRAISNVLVNLVSAPFRLLGSLVGGDSADIDSIKFQPGRTDVAPPEQQILQQLVEALSQRPQLTLEIPLLITEADRLALQTSVVNERINSRMELLGEEAGSLTDRRLAVLEAMHAEVALTPSLDELKLANTVENSTPNPLTGEPMISQELDMQAYVEDLRNRLISIEPVSEQQQVALAEARVAAVREYLATVGVLGEEQIQTGEAQNPEPDDDGWLLMEFGLSTR